MFFIDSDLILDTKEGGKCEEGDLIGHLKSLRLMEVIYILIFYPFTVTYIPNISGDLLLDVELELEYALETASFSNNGFQLYLENGENQIYLMNRDGSTW